MSQFRLLLGILLAFGAPVHAQLLISEFLASNSNSIRDNDGQHEDWIEIRNMGGSSVNLLGWYLTDQPDQPRRWALPARNLNSGEFLVVFASNKNRTNPASTLHTNFRLDPDGEYLALTKDIAGGGVQIVQEFNPYPRQFTDVAYGTQGTVTTTALVAAGAPAKALVPTTANGGNSLAYSAWTGASASEPFNDSAWTVGTTAIGFPNGGVAPASLKLRLNADTGTALTADSSGAAHHGTNNTATWMPETTDANGRTRHGALLFGATDSNSSATGDQVVVPAHADFNVASGTIMFWIKTAGNVADGGNVEGAMLFDRRVGTGLGQGLVMYLREAGNLQIQPGPTAVNTFASTGMVRDDRWHHVALVFNTASGAACTFYIDGAASGTRNNTGPWSFSASQQIEIGRSHDNYWRRFNGQLDDYRFYNTALTEAQIRQIFQDEDEPVTPGTDLQAAMQNVNPSAFIRVPFSVPNPAAFDGLNLTMRWNDGYIAWINGTQVSAFAAPATPAYDSPATQPHSAGAPLIAAVAPATTLRTGSNILAIQALNNAATNGTFSVLPQLEGTSTAIGTAGYLVAPTPGVQNSAAKTNLGPFVTNVTRNPTPRPLGSTSSPPLTINAKVLPSLRPLASTDPVQVEYLVMFGAEQTLPMLDDGVAPDTTANDSIYAAQIPTNNLGPGQMLRWRVVATDNTGAVSTDPEFFDPIDNEKYYGTVAVDSTIESNLPVLYWFTPTATAADNQTGTRSSFFFKAVGDTGVGRFYDNVEINVHGQSSAGFAKKSYDLDFNEDNRFEWHVTQRRVKDVNLLTNWGHKSKTHNALTHEAAAVIGAPSHWVFQVRVQQVTTANAGTPANQFWSIADMMEDGDDDWLDRVGLDGEGALYKTYDNLSGTGSSEKKSRQFEGKQDLQTLITGLNPATAIATRRAFAYDNLDLAQCVSYLVACAIASHQDHGHKNYYVYRDSRGTREWSILIWDTDLSWGRNWVDAGGYFTDTIGTANALNLYPGYNDGRGQGSVQNKGALNRFYGILFDSPEFRKMYLRRLRTVIDNYFAAPGVLESRVDAMTDAMDPPTIAISDADRDRTKWGNWGANGGFTAGSDVLRYHTGLLKNSYLAGRRTFLNSANARLYYTAGNPNPAPNNFETIPTSQSANVADLVTIETVDFNPASGTQNHEYFVVRNANTEAVDISGWKVTGAVDWTFKGGTVIPPGGGATQHMGDLFVAKDPYLFRQGATVPGGRPYAFVQGPYRGQLSARGETIELRDAAGTLLKTKTWTPAPTPLQEKLRITELNYAPVAPSTAESAALLGVVASDFEYVELLNISATPLDLGGARFETGVDFTFPTAFTLAAGARCLVVANQAAFQLRFGHAFDAQIAGVFGGNLDNNGETIQLVDNVGENILDFRYENTWLPPSNEGGRSLVIRDPSPDWQSYGLPTSWALSGQANGSPGGADLDLASAYEGWRYEHFTTADFPTAQNPNAPAAVAIDAEGDGLVNLGEYAFGRDPRAHDHSALAIASVVNVDGSDYAAITFTRRHKAVDVTWTVEASSDLSTWESIDLPVGALQDLGNGLERVTYRDSQPTSDGERFLRVRAVK